MESIESKLKQLEKEKTIYCSNLYSDRTLCLQISYQIWMLNVEKENLQEKNLITSTKQ
jgi:hypothetical protein